MKPPIPAQLADLPTWQGLVVPFVQVVLGDGSPDFRAVHESKRLLCVRDRLCSICGRPHGYYIVFLGNERDVTRRLFTEPGLHPVCADYSTAACAMISGRQTAFTTRPHRSDGKPCSDPECDCAGWVANGPARQTDAARQPWYRVTTRGYKPRLDRDGVWRAFIDVPRETRCIG